MYGEQHGVIFDVDGVLIDSYAAHYESWRSYAAARDFEVTPEFFASTFGRTNRDILQQIWPHREITEDEVRECDWEKERLFREYVRRDFPWMPGAQELIQQLAAAGFAMAAGSSGPRENIRLVLEHVDPEGRITELVTGDDVSRGKPDPEVFLRAAERLRLAPVCCVVIEDAPAGIEAAHRAGMCCVGLVSTGRMREQLRQADHCVDSLTELSPRLLGDLIRRGSGGRS